jgi:hypothetical protein
LMKDPVTFTKNVPNENVQPNLLATTPESRKRLGAAEASAKHHPNVGREHKKLLSAHSCAENRSHQPGNNSGGFPDSAGGKPHCLDVNLTV